MFNRQTHPKRKIKVVSRYLPVANMEQILAYRPDDASTFTASPLVNALCNVLFSTKLFECAAIAGYLGLDSRKFASAISIETGMNLSDIVDTYRGSQLHAFLAEHPTHDYSIDELAEALGYSSGRSISRFVRSQTGRTVKGRTSVASPDSFVKVRTEVRKKRREGRVE